MKSVNSCTPFCYSISIAWYQSLPFRSRESLGTATGRPSRVIPPMYSETVSTSGGGLLSSIRNVYCRVFRWIRYSAESAEAGSRGRVWRSSLWSRRRETRDSPLVLPYPLLTTTYRKSMHASSMESHTTTFIGKLLSVSCRASHQSGSTGRYGGPIRIRSCRSGPGSTRTPILPALQRNDG